MKKFFRNEIGIGFILAFMVLLFLYNASFKNCILYGCKLFFESVFPSLFPMFLINDLLMYYRFFDVVERLLGKAFKKVFHMSNGALYIFILSMFSGTPTNAYLTSLLVKEKHLPTKDAGIILSYSCFLNPLFLYTILTSIFFDSTVAFKLIFIHYSLNICFAFFRRNYPYQELLLTEQKQNVSFSKALSKSIERSFSIFINILGTIIFYLLLCEAINLFITTPLFNCIINGLLETTGGLAKLGHLSIGWPLKEVLASIFISFTGFSIHSQIKNILTDASIPYGYFFRARLLHAFLAACICIIIP